MAPTPQRSPSRHRLQTLRRPVWMERSFDSASPVESVLCHHRRFSRWRYGPCFTHTQVASSRRGRVGEDGGGAPGAASRSPRYARPSSRLPLAGGAIQALSTRRRTVAGCHHSLLTTSRRDRRPPILQLAAAALSPAPCLAGDCLMLCARSTNESFCAYEDRGNRVVCNASLIYPARAPDCYSGPPDLALDRVGARRQVIRLRQR